METAQRSPDEVREWLAGRPPLAELREAYPEEWEKVRARLGEATAAGDPGRLQKLVADAGRGGRPDDPRAEVRGAMTMAAVRKMCVAAATGVTQGKVRFNLWNGWLAQKLLFEGGGLRRKPVSLTWFALIWPLLRQRSYLMPLVEPKGIYCFYSRRLVKELATLIGDRSCVEIAAGDGTLTRFLAGEGVDVVATDDFSWDHSVDYGDEVVREDAATSLRERAPQVVLCSWPPAGNGFERNVFATPSVELYVVIASQHAFAAGNWVDYESQGEFDFAEAPELSQLVLPPELESAVYLFRRRSAEV